MIINPRTVSEILSPDPEVSQGPPSGHQGCEGAAAEKLGAHNQTGRLSEDEGGKRRNITKTKYTGRRKRGIEIVFIINIFKL